MKDANNPAGVDGEDSCIRRINLVMEGDLVIMEIDGDNCRPVRPTMIEYEQAGRIINEAYSVARRVIEAVNAGKMTLNLSKIARGVLFIRLITAGKDEIRYLRIDPGERDIVCVASPDDPNKTRGEQLIPAVMGLPETMDLTLKLGDCKIPIHIELPPRLDAVFAIAEPKPELIHLEDLRKAIAVAKTWLE